MVTANSLFPIHSDHDPYKLQQLALPCYTLMLTPPGRPLAENFFLPKASTSQYLIVFLISTFQL